MSSAALLEADFGSESEDDNFNPAPADDSEVEEVGDFNDEVGLKSNETYTWTPERRLRMVRMIPIRKMVMLLEAMMKTRRTQRMMRMTMRMTNQYKTLAKHKFRGV